MKMSNPRVRKLFAFAISIFCLAALSFTAHAANPGKAAKASKEKLVLMPLHVAEEDRALQGAMETALVEGLQQKYIVFSGEQVAQKAREIFKKESRNTAKKECDETRCMQDIAGSFQAELIASANVTKQSGGYFLALSIQNIFDNKVEYSKSLPCRGCDSFQVVEKLKELVGTPAPIAAAPMAEAPQPKVKASDAETDLWEEVKKGNTEDDYQAYVKQYPKGKYMALAKTRLAKMQAEPRAEAERQEKQTWEDAQQTNSIESYESYLNDYPKGRYVALAQGRAAKLKKEQTDEEARQKREQAAGQEGASESESRLGLVVSELNDAQKAELEVEGGLIVEDMKGPAARSQLQRGDVILAVGTIEIHNFDQFNEVLKKVPGGRSIALVVRRSEGTVYVAIKLDEK